MNIVLLEPEIPFNAGNVGRTCVATGSTLHLIKPLGFKIDDKSLKRAGLDYWQHLKVNYYEDFNDFLNRNINVKIYMATTKSKMKYNMDDYIMFGKESAGIPEEILLKYKNTAIRIPMYEEYRSLNLSSSVAIVLYEALRQNNFKNLVHEGNLHRHRWEDDA